MSKSEDTKQLILDTAKKEFMEKGYNDASVRSIAKQAGLTTGAIFGILPIKKACLPHLCHQLRIICWICIAKAENGASLL